MVFPAALLFFAVVILVFVIIPQISSVGATGAELSEKREKVAKLTASLTTVQNANDEQVNDNLTTATTALPTSKDIVLIFSALTSAASDAGVGLVDFSLQAGGVFGRAAEIDATGGVSGVPAITVDVQTTGDAKDVASFIRSVQQTLPLSEVKVVSSDDAGTHLKVSFFYKPLDKSVNNEREVTPLTQADLNLINQLKSWNQ